MKFVQLEEICLIKPGMVAHTWDAYSWEVEVGQSGSTLAIELL